MTILYGEDKLYCIVSSSRRYRAGYLVRFGILRKGFAEFLGRILNYSKLKELALDKNCLSSIYLYLIG